MVENRFVGMKSRGVYEAPGMTMLYAAHRLVEQLTMDRDLMHLRDRLAPEVAEMVYYGFWYHAKLDALMAFIRQAQEPVTGEVALESLQGQHRRRRPQQPQQSCTTKASPRWKAAARTTRPTPKGSCGFKGCPAACREGCGRGSIRHGQLIATAKLGSVS